MPLNEFKVLTFDCYGTLIDWESGILSTIRPWLDAHQVEKSDDEILSLFSDLNTQFCKSEPQANYRDILFKIHKQCSLDFKIDTDASTSEQAALEFSQSVADWPVFSDTIDALRYLQDHYKLAILSNIDNKSIHETCKKMAINFLSICTAEDIGSYKPDVTNFNYLTQQLSQHGLDKSDILHMSVSLFFDHAPAKEIGLSTCLIRRLNNNRTAGAAPAYDSGIVPDYQFDHLSDFVLRHKELTRKASESN